MSTATFATHRVRAGLYELTIGTATYEIEKAWDGRGWHVFEQTGGYRGEWCQWFPTKWQAVEDMVVAAEKERTP